MFENISYKEIISNLPIGYAYHKILCDDKGSPYDYEYIEINKAFEDITGFSRNNIIGKSVTKVLPEIRNCKFDWINTYGEVALTGVEKKFEQFSEPLKKWYRVHAFSPEKGYFVTIVIDITEEKNHILDLNKIMETSEYYLSLNADELDYQKITDTFLKISEAKVAAFNLYDEDGKTYQTVALSGVGEIINKAAAITGINFNKMKWKHDAKRAEKIKSRIITRFNELYDLAGDFIPKTVCDLVTNTLALGETVLVKITNNNIMLGDFTFIMPKGKIFNKDSVVKLYSNQLGLALINMREENILLNSERQYRLLTTQMQLGLALHDIICDDDGNPIDYRFKSVNESYEKLTGLRGEDIIGKTLLEVLPNTEKYWIERFGAVALTGKSDRYENYSAEIGKYYSTIAYSPQIGQFAVIVDDITNRKEMDNKLFSEKEQFKTTLLSVGDGVISTNEKGEVQILNPVAEQLTGWMQEDAKGRPIEDVLNIVNEFTREKCENPAKKVFETGEIIELANHTILISKDGTERPIEDSAAPIKVINGNIVGVVLVFRDFTEKKKNQDEIKHLSFHDHLTGLYNRRYFEAEIEMMDIPSNLPLSIIMGDVNGLKLINDTFGHDVGDILLEKISKIISSSCFDNSTVARIGGDEFAILLPKTDGTEAKKLINKMKHNLGKEKIKNLELSVSFGYETKTVSNESINLVLRKAEDFMYNNKLFEGPGVRGKVIQNIVETINRKSPREKAHSERVSQICYEIAKCMDLDDGEANKIKVFGLLHDIGKIAIDDSILNKQDELTESEYKEIRRHAEIGYRILSTVNDMTEIADYVLHHHERWDGNGYPKGIKGTDIPLASRICSIADAFDAITSHRTYRTAEPVEFAINELKKNAGKQFDPEILDIFLRGIGDSSRIGDSSWGALSTTSVAKK